MVENPGVNLNIMDGQAFFAHEVSINFTPSQLALDFKCITPRVDPRGKGKPTFLMQHNVVMMEPWHAKKFLEIMQDMVKRYEKEFGKITKPASVEKAEKRQKSRKPEKKGETPAYFG